MTLKYTADQVRTREFAQINRGVRPNAWWGWAGGSDCMAAQAYILGLRTNRFSTTPHEISIAAFRDHYGWDEVPISEARAGYLLLEEWTSKDHTKLVGIPTHIEWINTIDHDAGSVNICSGNTGPAPGDPTPVGFWRKTRPLNDRNFLKAIVVPYKGAAVTSPYGAKAPTGLTKTQIKVVAAYLNQILGGPDTAASKDGIPGRIYWTNVQLWGRGQGIYGPGFKIDGIPGPRTKQVEAAAYKAATKR